VKLLKLLINMAKYPDVKFTDSTMREGLQIESPDIPVDDKVRLLDAISETGLKRIVVGSFVHPRWVPQMAKIDEVLAKFTPNPDVIYTALYMGSRGLPRYMEHVPPLTPPRTYMRTTCHACDVFAKRNTNRHQADEIARWRHVIEAAVEKGVEEATIYVNAAFGSNWCGDIPQEFVMRLFQKQWDMWNEAGVSVTSIGMGDPMGWNMPDQVQRYIHAIRERWPEINDWHFHIHNTRGVGIVSHYVILTNLETDDTVWLDGTLGGMGGCPYCGNGRAAGMVPTEDLLYMTQELGIRSGELKNVDLHKLIDAACIAEEVVGHPLWGHVSKAGPRPRGDGLYAMDMPFVSTLEEASHFRNGPSVYADCLSPWEEPIKSPMRDYADWNYGKFKGTKEEA
jgi:hydroxymethylglutaryl-CoA lyase